MKDAEAVELLVSLGPIDGPKPPPHTWERHRFELRKHAAQAGTLARFLTWSTVQATMFVGTGADFVAPELEELDAAGPRWRKAMTDPGVGGPDYLPCPGVVSGNSAHQAYHAFVFEKVAGAKVRDMEAIVEFGGGYGAFAVVCRRLGFQGAYHIFDLPEMAVLQHWYLEEVGVRACIHPAMREDGAALSSTDSYEWGDWLDVDVQPDLMVGLWSLSETPVRRRTDFLREFHPRHMLLAYQTRWGNVDNERYFKTMRGLWSDLLWEELPAARGSVYLVGLPGARRGGDR